MKKYFNFRLYKEALRQQRIIGWMSFIVLALEAAIVPLGYVMSGSFYRDDNLIVETAMQMHPLMLALLAVAPLLVLYQFNFMNHRKACDFYHAIPDRRISVFISMMAAVLTWCVFLIVSGYGLAVVIRLLIQSPVRFSIAYGEMFQYMATLIAGCLFMSGLAALAMTLTGTAFTNVLTMVLIGVAPRAITSIMYGMMYDCIPFVDYSASSLLTNWGYNIPLGMFAILFSSEVLNTWLSWSAIAYTTAIGILYMVLAAWLFHRRKSESAGRSATSPVMQAVFRMIIPLGISLSVTTALVVGYRSGYGVDSDELFIYLTFYVVAVVAYLLYELITSRQWRQVWRSLPGLLVLLAINLIGALGIQGWFAYQTGFLPKAGEIVQVEYIDSIYAYSFITERLSGVTITNREFCDAVAGEITAQTEAWNESPNAYYDYDDGHDEYEKYVFRVKEKSGVTWIREIWLKPEQRDLMEKCITENQELQERIKDISGGTDVYFYANWSDTNIDEDNGALVLYQMMQQEVRDMDFADWYGLLMGHKDYAGQSIQVHMYFNNGSYRYHNLYVELPADLFPETYNMYLSMTLEHVGTNQAELMKLLHNPDVILTYAEIVSYMGNGQQYTSFYDGECDMEAVRQHLIDCLTPAQDAAFTTDSYIVRIVVEGYTAESEGDGTDDVIVKGDGENVEDFIAGVQSKSVMTVESVQVKEEYLYLSATYALTKEQYTQLVSKSFKQIDPKA